MNDVRELVSRSLDESLSPEETAVLEEALARDAELRVFRQDLLTIKKLAAATKIAPTPEMPVALRERVTRTYAGKHAKVVPLRRFISHPLVLAASLLIGLGLTYFLVEREPPGSLTEGDEAYHDLRADVLQAQEHFHQAVAKLEEAAMDRIASMPPDIAHHFAQNLNIIDQAIRDCESMTDKYLGNHLNYVALSKAYQAKVQLLQLILES